MISTTSPVAGLFAVLALWLAPVSALEAQTLDDVSWQYQRYSDGHSAGSSVSEAVIGVPQTDLVIGRVVCSANGGGVPELVLSADMGGQPPGTPAGVTLYADAGPISLGGSVKPILSEEDFSGINVTVALRDPLWQVLGRMSSISYVIAGNQYVLPLRGSSRALSALLADCNAYAGGGGFVSAPRPTQPADPRWATCDAFGSFVSQNSDIPVAVTFTNRSDGYRVLFWIGFDGAPVEYAALSQGQSFSVTTYVTHPWMITDGPGNCLEMFMPQPGVGQFDISAPNRDFGPE